MQFADLAEFLSKGISSLSGGAVAILFMEDQSETNSTIRHHVKLGFTYILVLGSEVLRVSPELVDKIHRIPCDLRQENALTQAINPIIAVLSGRWCYYGFNAEYLFYPFCETRSIGEVTTFASEERRDSILTYVIDLYAESLETHPDGVSLESAQMDQSGYYAQARSRDGLVLERQLDMYGGLRWWFEEHVPVERRKIDRIGLFKAAKGLELRPDHTFNVEEYNTYACPWHNNVTAAVCSFRAAKSLKTNAGSSAHISTFQWHNSRKFTWHSRQLLDLGLIEPGQWF